MLLKRKTDTQSSSLMINGGSLVFFSLKLIISCLVFKVLRRLFSLLHFIPVGRLAPTTTVLSSMVDSGIAEGGLGLGGVGVDDVDSVQSPKANLRLRAVDVW